MGEGKISFPISFLLFPIWIYWMWYGSQRHKWLPHEFDCPEVNGRPTICLTKETRWGCFQAKCGPVPSVRLFQLGQDLYGCHEGQAVATNINGGKRKRLGYLCIYIHIEIQLIISLISIVALHTRYHSVSDIDISGVVWLQVRSASI